MLSPKVMEFPKPSTTPQAKSVLKNIYANVAQKSKKATEDNKKGTKREAEKTFSIVMPKRSKLNEADFKRYYNQALQQISRQAERKTGMNLKDIEGMERVKLRRTTK